MRNRPIRLITFAVLLVLAALPPLYASTATENSSRESVPRDVRVFAVRPPADAAFADALKRGVFARWILPRDASARLEVGPEARGDVEILVDLLPAMDLRPRLAGLPVELRDAAIVLGGTLYDEPRHALGLRLPNANVRDEARSDVPAFIVVGQQVESVARLTDQLLVALSGHRWHRLPPDVDYLLFEHPWSHRSGKWQKDAEGHFKVDPDERDDMAVRARTYAALTPLERQHVLLRAPSGAASYEALADELERAAATMAKRIPVEIDAPLEVIVESDLLTQGRHLGAIGRAVVDEARPRPRLHVVHPAADADAGQRDASLHGVARLLLRRAGFDLPPVLEEGAALWLSREWYGRDYAEWLPAFALAEVLPEPEEVLARERSPDGSAVLWPPVAAAVVERLPGESLRQKLAALPTHDAVARHLDAVAALADEATPVPRESAPLTGFQNGISLAMANGLEIGYHAPGVGKQLARLAGLGANSVSLMPFAYQPAPDVPELRFLNHSPSSETDVGLVHAARRAWERGFTVLWKPHIWISHDSWPGEIAMASEEDWRAWWRSYRRFVVHHAVLARFTGSEIFCVGVELGKTVEREKEWRQLISAVRRIYPGAVTYAGNWWGDYDRVPFWDALDYVGVDAYFPLAHEREITAEALREGARRAVGELAAAAKRWGKPILLTEVGFAARHGAWIDPHQEGGTFSEVDQARAYQALLDALERPSWLAGMYVWKVFSHPSAEGGERPDFRFLGRRAETVVRSYFSAE